jgi:hypothetical protein
MLKMMAIALKYGLPGLITIASEYGVPMAAIAFFVFYPLAHIMLGIALLIFAAFIPRLPGDDTKHIINVGNKLSFKGNARTALLAGALFIIFGSVGEWMASAFHGAIQ